MLIPLGFWAASAGGAAGAGSFDLLETTVLGSNQATVTFSSLAATYGADYQHLQIRGVIRTARSGQTNDTVIYNLNGDFGSNYARHYLRGNGSSVVSSAATSQARIELSDAVSAGNTAANIFTPFVLDILDPFETTKNTTTRHLTGQAAATYFGSGDISLWSGLWNNTAALTTITFDAIGDFLTGSRFSLYGIKAGA